MAGGFLEDRGAVVVVVAGFGVDCFSGWRPRFSAVFAGSLGVVGFGVVGVFAAAGDFVGGFVLVARVVVIGLGTGLLAVAVVFGASSFGDEGPVLLAVFAGLSFTRELPAPFAALPLSVATPWPLPWLDFASALTAVPDLPGV